MFYQIQLCSTKFNYVLPNMSQICCEISCNKVEIRKITTMYIQKGVYRGISSNET